MLTTRTRDLNKDKSELKPRYLRVTEHVDGKPTERIRARQIYGIEHAADHRVLML